MYSLESCHKTAAVVPGMASVHEAAAVGAVGLRERETS